MPKKPKLEKLSDEENDKIYELAKSCKYTDKQIGAIFKKVEKYDLNFKTVETFVNWGFKASEMNNVLKLSDGYELDSLKLINHYVKNGRNQKPKKINDRISQKTRAVTHFENGLKRIKKFKLDDNMNIQIPLEGGKSRDLHFDSVEAFEAYKENEIKTVEDKIDYEKGKVEHWTNLKKFKEALR